MKGKREKKFLREVQDELEEQRGVWKDEVDRLMSVSEGYRYFMCHRYPALLS